ncbi:serine/threonine protein kinase [Paracoccus sp. MC1854]|uniref:serine/threonine-protein kinase n=1 Tax=Paracoccus sp. MC1854 TaxID=2760306 RepID=UPI0016002712|nr:serine/threonine-protein kinase [Paracoccus sp. MC1854]MBB1490597.1 serine/threonine protein kinase [Paracoccus sp. MC1854]
MIPSLPGDIFRPGQVLNNTWTVEGVLGRGGTGEVYRACSLVTGRIVAIKALSAQFAGDEGYLELMRREEAMRNIIHDAVVRYSECSRTAEGNMFLVMDFIDGPALSEVMNARRLSPRELLIIAHRVAEGLAAAHVHGVVHRDLSPDNIILRDNRVEGATIIDFGIAKDTFSRARSVVGNQFAGKYEYAAPEQFEGKAVPASDLYALGATLAAAARGEIPFAGSTPGEMIRRKSEPLDVSGLPEPLAGLILWLSAPKLADRAPSATAVLARLDSLLKGQPQAPARGGRSTTGDRGTKRARKGGGLGRAWLAGLAAVLLVAATILLVRPLVGPDLPLAAPWRLEAASSPAPRLSGHAPNTATAGRIAGAVASATGAPLPPDALAEARGMPAPGWATAMERLFPELEGLEDWIVSVTDLTVEIAGRAASTQERDIIAERLESWAHQSGMTLRLDLTAPVLLSAAEIEAVSARHAACGALTSDIPNAGVPDDGSVTITGTLPDAGAEAALAGDLGPLVGARTLRLDIETLDTELCRIQAALAGLPEGGVTIRLSEARRPERSLTGIYHPGDNPVADVLIPTALAATPGAELWLALAYSGKVYPLRPTLADEETRLDRIGQASGALHIVRALWTADEVKAVRGRAGFTVNDKDFGKAGLFALISQGPLFPERRPGDESAASFAEAVAARRAARPDLVLAATFRALDLRPRQ